MGLGGKYALPLAGAPVTSLFRCRRPAARTLKVFLSSGVQGMLDPITPLGCDALREFFADAPAYLGCRSRAKPNLCSIQR